MLPAFIVCECELGFYYSSSHPRPSAVALPTEGFPKPCSILEWSISLNHNLMPVNSHVPLLRENYHNNTGSVDPVSLEAVCWTLMCRCVSAQKKKGSEEANLPCEWLFHISVILGLHDDCFTRRCRGCATVAARRAFVTRFLTSGKLIFSVDIFLGARFITVLAPTIGRSLGVLVCSRHKPLCVEKELVR